MRVFAIAAALLLCAGVQAHADVTYVVYVNDQIVHGIYIFYEPTFLTTDTVIEASQFALGAGPATLIELNPAAPVCGGVTAAGFSACLFVTDPGVSVGDEYSTTLTSDGDYFGYDHGSFSEVDISGTPAVAGPTGVAPEPSSVLLLGTGLAGGFAALRRRRAR
jgi:hypothetical protein